MNPAIKWRIFRLRNLSVAGFGCGIGACVLCLWAGQKLVAPAQHRVGPPPADMGAVPVTIPSQSGSQLSGWFMESATPTSTGGVLLLHGIRSDRRAMMGRARFLRAAGFHTLCIDLQAHGESPGEHITLGWLESRDAAAGVAWLRDRHPGLPVAVLGTSLGGAAAILDDYDDHPPDALVVEAVYADVETAVGNRLEMRLGKTGRWLTPLLTWQIGPVLGFDRAELDTVRAIARIDQPVFVLSGTDDRHATTEEAERLFAAALGPKEKWEIPGAAHVDFHHREKDEYEKRVGDFLRKWMAP